MRTTSSHQRNLQLVGQKQSNQRSHRPVRSKGRRRPHVTHTAEDSNINEYDGDKQTQKSAVSEDEDRKHSRMVTHNKNVVNDISTVKNDSDVAPISMDTPLAADHPPLDIDKNGDSVLVAAVPVCNEIVSDMKLSDASVSTTRIPNRVTGGEGDAGNCETPLK